MILFFNKGRLGNQLFHYAFLRGIQRPGEGMLLVGMKPLFRLLDMYNCHCTHFDKYPFRTPLGYCFGALSRLRLITSVGLERDASGHNTLNVYEKKGLITSIRHVRPDHYASENLMPKDIANLFHIRREHRDAASAFLDRLPRNAAPVFIHVRQGDYLAHSCNGVRDISLPKAYYTKAMALVRQWIAFPYFIVLTDDVEYCEKQFASNNDLCVSRNSMYVDFAIMTLCRAAIISNSTFSWWGAKLGVSKTLIISPKYWFGWKTRCETPAHIQASCFTPIDFEDLE